jgi:hypothetical protein
MSVSVSTTNKPLNPRAQDLSPKGYNRAALYSGKALDFDGVNDVVEVADNANLSFGNGTTDSPFSITGYFNLDTLGANQVIAAKDGAGATNREYSLFVTSSNQLRFFIKNNGGVNQQSIDSDLVLESGKWYFVSATYDGRGGSTAYQGLNIYVNAQLTEVSTFTADPYTAMANTTAPFTAGVYASNWMNGQLSNIKVFSGAFTAAQVADLYLNPEKIVPDGVADSALKLWLPMMEGAGTTAYDGSGNGNHGTISGATWVSGIGAPVAQTALVSWNKGTNLVAYSEQFDNAAWTKANCTVTANYATSPDGYQNADLLYPSSTGVSRECYKAYTYSSGLDYVFSVYVKAGGLNWVFIGTDYAGGGKGAWFNLSTGTIGTQISGYSASIENAGGGYYRCSVKFNQSVASNYYTIILADANNSFSVTKNGTDGILIWGASITQSSSVQPYIPTLATAQTSPVLLPQGLTANKDITGVNAFESARNPYALNLDGASWGEVHDNASLDFGTGSFTLEAWAKAKFVNQGSSFNVLMSMGLNISNAYSVGMLVNQLLEPIFIYNNTGTAEAARTEGEWVHIVGTYDETSATIYVNGVQKDQDARTAADMTNTLVKHIGRDTTSVRFYNDQIALPRIYNRALTATEVARNYNADKSKFGL